MNDWWTTKDKEIEDLRQELSNQQIHYSERLLVQKKEILKDHIRIDDVLKRLRTDKFRFNSTEDYNIVVERIKQLTNHSPSSSEPLPRNEKSLDASKSGEIGELPLDNNNVCKNCNYTIAYHPVFKGSKSSGYKLICSEFEPKESLNRSCAN